MSARTGTGYREWRRFALAVLARAGRDAGTQHGEDIEDFIEDPVCELLCELAEVDARRVGRALLVKVLAGGRKIHRLRSGAIWVGPEKPS